VETTTVQDVNPFFLRLTGFARENFVGNSVSEAGSLLSVEAAIEEIVAETKNSEVVRRDDVQITTHGGSILSVEVVANRYRVGTQPVVQLNVRDISDRKAAMQALRDSEERFRLMAESVRDYAIFQMDDEGRIITWNVGAERLLGWPESEILGKSVAVVFTPEDVERGEAARELEKARTEGRSEDERWHIRKDGTRFYASGVLTRSPEHGGESAVTLTKVMQDITLRKEQDEKLRRSLEEKSLLVREIHHRVKNNLQMLVSLLSLQANHSEDPRVLAAFEETESRVRAVAHVHEQLYASDDLSTIEVGSYLGELARELVALQSRTAAAVDGIRLHVDVGKLLLHIEKAVPVGLIANELILNSLKHGLRGGGDLRLSFTASGQDSTQATLVVEDSGPGLPAGLDLSESKTMGYQLIRLLIRQLRGRLDIVPGPGTRITVSFPISSSPEGGEDAGAHSNR
jgi:PAS domain S-box-containing protein